MCVQMESQAENAKSVKRPRRTARFYAASKDPHATDVMYVHIIVS